MLALKGKETQRKKIRVQMSNKLFWVELGQEWAVINYLA